MINFFLIGNTHIKVFSFANEKPTVRIYAHDTLPLLFSEVPAGTNYLASVAPKIAASLSRELSGETVVLNGTHVTRIKNTTRFPEQTGIDRLLNCAAANYLYPQEHTIVADCGTALSVSVTTAGGEYLGGAITSGITATAKALNISTALLPDISTFETPESAIGQDTKAAINCGILWEKAGFIKEYSNQTTKELQKKGPAPVRVILTGGWASILMPLLSTMYHFEPYLTLTGVTETVNSYFYNNSKRFHKP